MPPRRERSHGAQTSLDETFPIPNPLTTTGDGLRTVPYTGPDAHRITVGGELNKLASNVGFGRIFAGIHWRQDIEQGMLMRLRLVC